MQPNAIASIVQAMLASSQPTVSQMIASRGGGGGGMNIRPQGTNLDLSLPSRSQQNAPELVVPELTPPVAGGAPSDIGAPSDMQPPDPYQSGQYRQEDDPVMAAETRTTSGAGIQPDAVPLIQQSLEAQIGLWEAENPTTLRGAWNRGKNVRDAREKVAMSRANIFSYEQAQAFAAKEKEANRVGRMADEAYSQTMVATGGDQEYSRQVASMVQNDPDNAQQYIGRMMDSVEAQRVEQTEFAREDAAEELKGKQRFHVYSQGFGIPDPVASSMANNTDLSVDAGVKLWMEDQKSKRDNKILIAKENEKVRDELYKADQTINTVEKALSDVGYFTTGLGSVFSILPGTPAANLEAAIDTLNAVQGFKELFDMRQASTTGGALGNVSNKEIELLYQAWTSLQRYQSPERMRTNLNEVLERFQRVKYLAQASSEGLLLGKSAFQQEEMASEHLSDLKHESFMIDNPTTGRRALQAVRDGLATPAEFEAVYGFTPIPDWEQK